MTDRQPSNAAALARANLGHRPARFVIAAGGVGFAVFLMLVEMGFLTCVFDSQIQLVERFDADLVVVDRFKESAYIGQPFDRSRLYAALGDTAVASVHPVYLQEYGGRWESSSSRSEHPIVVLGIDPAAPALAIPELEPLLDSLKQPHTVAVDSLARDYFGPLQEGVVAEINDRRFRIVGTFELGPNFRADGHVVVSSTSFAQTFPLDAEGRPSLERVEFGLVRLHPGHDPDAAAARIGRRLPPDVKVLTKAGMVATVQQYWQREQPIGSVFGIGMAVGFIIGVVICYQILFTDVSDLLPQFATLKAVGYRDRFLLQVVVAQALYLSLAGFIAGTIGALGVYSFLQAQTGILMRLTLFRGGLVLAMTVTMCLGAGTLAARRAMAADPAELF